MRANLVVIGSHGDVLPFVAIGAELRRRGFTVTAASAEPFGPLFRKEGLGFHSLATTAQFDELASHADLWHPILGLPRLLDASMRMMQPAYDFVAQNMRGGETITVASSIAFGARIAQEVLQGPLVTIHIPPMLLFSRIEPPRLPGLRLPDWLPRTLRGYALDLVCSQFLDRLCRPVNAMRADLGLSPVRNIIPDWWNSPDQVIAMFPSWYAPAQDDWPLQTAQVDFPAADLFGDRSTLDDELLSFLDRGRKPVVVTFGSAMLHADRLYDRFIHLCRTTAHRVVIVSPAPRLVPPDLAGRVAQVRYAPFSLLLPRCAAIVHHGGIGTVAQAMAAGTPQLIIPFAFDHFDEAARVRRLGIGSRLSRSRLTVRAIEAELRRLESSAIKSRCEEVAAQMRGRDGAKGACDIIEAVFARRLGSNATGEEPAKNQFTASMT